MTVVLKDGRKWQFQAVDGQWIYRTPKNIYRLFFDVGTEHSFPFIYICRFHDDPVRPCWYRAPERFKEIPFLGGRIVFE